jgi:hypothetical protein
MKISIKNLSVGLCIKETCDIMNSPNTGEFESIRCLHRVQFSGVSLTLEQFAKLKRVRSEFRNFHTWPLRMLQSDAVLRFEVISHVRLHAFDFKGEITRTFTSDLFDLSPRMISLGIRNVDSNPTTLEESIDLDRNRRMNASDVALRERLGSGVRILRDHSREVARFDERL